jgi:hypothetical protein
MESTRPTKTSGTAFVAFCVLALSISWGTWAPWVASARAAPSQPSWRYLHLVGSLGPCVAALVVLGWTGGRARLRAFIRQLATARGGRVALRWGILFPTAAFVGSAVIMGMTRHASVRWDRVGVAPLLSLASGSVLTAWLYERAEDSVLPAAVLHAVLDVFFLAEVGVPVQSIMGAAVTVWGILVAVPSFRRRNAWSQ